MQNKICHITSVHPRFDTRIFHKECKSLAKYYDVTLLVNDCLPSQFLENVSIISSGKKNRNRIIRMISTQWTMLQLAIKQHSNVYHIHDPELIIIGLILKIINKKVIYDIHEDVPRQILSKFWIPIFLRKIISSSFEALENFCAKRFDYIICATDHITQRFLKLNSKTSTINNYPLLSEYEALELSNHKKENAICYVGGITRIRGLKDLIEAIALCPNTTLYLAGPFESESFQSELERMPGWKNTKYLGVINRSDVIKVYEKSKAGVVIFHPLPNHINACPNKIFEYLASGIPLICSNFSYWQSLISDHDICQFVNPQDPKEIAAAIIKLTSIDNFEELSIKCKTIINEYANWESEGRLLVDLIYRKHLMMTT